MKTAVSIALLLAIFGGAILSLDVRRRYARVGVITGALVLIVLWLGLGGLVLSHLSPSSGSGDSAGGAQELGSIFAVLVMLVAVAGTIGRFQGRALRVARGVAWLGGVGQLVPLTLVMALIRPETGFDGAMPFAVFSVDENVWVGLCLACIVAELLAPVILVRVLRRSPQGREGSVPGRTRRG